MSQPPLNDEQKGILQQKTVSLNRPIDDLIALLAPIAKADATGDKRRVTLGCTAALAFVASVFAAMLIPKIGVAVFVPLFITGVVLIVLFRRSKKEDISDNLRVTALPMLVALRDDFSKDPVSLKLDLRSPTAKEKKTNEQKGTGMMKTVESFYVDPWLTCEATLADGSRLQWSVVDHIRERKRWKKSTSGKYKQKTKLKKKVDVDAELRPNKKTYAAAGDDKKLTVSKKIERTDGDPVPPGVILSVLTELYAQVQPATK